MPADDLPSVAARGLLLKNRDDLLLIGAGALIDMKTTVIRKMSRVPKESLREERARSADRN